MRRLALIALGLALAAPAAQAAGCPDTPAAGFQREGSTVGFGYFVAAEPIKAGSFTLGHMHVGGDEEFAAFSGGERLPEYAPIMLEFEDTSAGRVATETGDGPARSIRVLPDGFCLIGDQIRFTGEAKEIGRVTFSGAIKDGTTVAGMLTVGDQSFDAVSLDYTSGD